VSEARRRALRRKVEGQLRHGLSSVAGALLMLIGLRAGLGAESGQTLAEVVAPHLVEAAVVAAGPVAAHVWSWMAPEKRED